MSHQALQKKDFKGLRGLNDATEVMSSNEYESSDIYSLKIGCEMIDIVTRPGSFVAQEYDRDFFRLDQDADVYEYKVSKLRYATFDLNGMYVLREPPRINFKRIWLVQVNIYPLQ